MRRCSTRRTTRDAVTPDVNVLVAAFRADHPHHRSALDWLNQARAACEAGRAPLRVLPMVLCGFLRLVTNPKVFAQPDSIDDLGSIHLARDVAKKIEESLQYPGQIKVTVIRETRAVDYAR